MQTLSPQFEKLLLSAPIDSERDLAADVLALSDFYLAQPGEVTPWREDFAANAYLRYFLPLNYARLREAWREVERAQISPTQIWDFGSGLGTTQWMLEDQTTLSPVELYCIETAKEAVQLHKDLQTLRAGQWRAQFQTPFRPAAGALAVFSYSFLEMQSRLPHLDLFDHLLIVEPSMHECARQLMQWRKTFLQQGYHVLAPCTHAEECPLLKHSSRDWCHMRIGFEPPAWWKKFEHDLPMKNRTLTYSYLLLSRKESSHPAEARVIGDTLNERGKTRQMLCRGPERQFLSWLHRHGPPPSIPHGALLWGLDSLEDKGLELRANPQSNLRWTT